MVTTTTAKYYGGRDPATVEDDYFGVLKEIIELFKRLWYDIGSERWTKIENWFIILNSKRLSLEGTMCFYITSKIRSLC